MEKLFHEYGNLKKAGVAILTLDLKIKTVTRDKEGHYIIIKGLIQQEDIVIVNIYIYMYNPTQHLNT